MPKYPPGVLRYLPIKAHPREIHEHVSLPFEAKSLEAAKSHMLVELFGEEDVQLLERHNLDVVLFDDEWRQKYESALEREHGIRTAQDGDRGR